MVVCVFIFNKFVGYYPSYVDLGSTCKKVHLISRLKAKHRIMKLKRKIYICEMELRQYKRR